MQIHKNSVTCNYYLSKLQIFLREDEIYNDIYFERESVYK